MKAVKDMDILEIVLGLEGGELVVNDFDDLEAIKNVCIEFMYSQGFYGRLLRDIEDMEDDLTVDDFPIYF